MKKSRNYISLGDAIEQFLAKHGLKKQAKFHELKSEWAKLMGAPIANNTEKMWLHEGILYIKMKNPVWRQELQLARNKILKMANEHMGIEAVKEVRIF